jgi:type IV pilus assembly protein PilO
MASMDLKNPSVQKALLGVLVAGGVLGVFFGTHLLPITFPVQQQKLDALKADYEKKSTDLARARATVADLPRFEAEYQQLHDQWTLAAELLPADKQLPGLLRRITLAGEQTGVQFVLFKPAGVKGETYYSEIPVEISVSGGYHQVGSFLAELANLRRIVTVSNVHLKTNTGATTDPLATTSAEFTASAYSLNPGPAPAAPATPAAKGDAHARKSS